MAGSKRKATTTSNKKEEEKQQIESSRAKRSKITDKEKPDEYFEEKRNMEDLWKSAFPIGTEWHQLDSVYKYNWNFTNLEDAFKEGGVLDVKKKNVYLFSVTEPQLILFKDEIIGVCIPAVVAVVSPFPPSDKIGITSVQRGEEEIIPMKKMKMDWVPYIPLQYRSNHVIERFKSSSSSSSGKIFVLSCTQRRASLEQLTIERLKEYEYCLPYFYQPLTEEDELENNTIVDIIFEAESDKPLVVCDFDWELDELDEFVDDKTSKKVIKIAQKEKFKEFVKEKVREAKKANRDAREARKKAVEEMTEETKNAYENMRFYKFYPVPSPDTPDVSGKKSKFINRYYGKAHQMF